VNILPLSILLESRSLTMHGRWPSDQRSVSRDQGGETSSPQYISGLQVLEY
jgi:hypothetical protein